MSHEGAGAFYKSCGEGLSADMRFCPHCGRSRDRRDACIDQVPIEGRRSSDLGLSEGSSSSFSDEEIDLLLASDDILALVDDESEGQSPMGASPYAPCEVAGQEPVLPQPARPARPSGIWRNKRAVVPAVAAFSCALLLALSLQGLMHLEGSAGGAMVSSLRLTYSWEYGGEDYSIEVTITEDSYDYYADQGIARGMSSSEDCDLVLGFITADDETVIEVAGLLMGMAGASTASSHELLSLALAFVQDIPYSYDGDTYGADEYWAFPVETLYVGTGDCEDKSFLYASLVEAMGMDAVILIYSDHVAVGVNDTGVSGTYYLYQGTKYYYCETTEVGWEIGDRLPRGYSAATVIDVG